jgi:hypothetical protein
LFKLNLHVNQRPNSANVDLQGKLGAEIECAAWQLGHALSLTLISLPFVVLAF